MKRTLLMILSILLAASSVFGIVTAGNGSDELSDILRFKRGQRSDILDFVDILDGRVAELRKAEENRTEDEKDYTESVVTDQKGTEQYNAGQQQYNAGAAKIAKGQAEYDAAEAQYNAKLAEYQAAEKRLNDAEAQLNDAKAQRDAAQAQLDAATPAYEKAKPIYDLIQSLGGWGDLVSQTLAKYGYTSIEDLKAEMKAYEDGQAALAQANSQIAAASLGLNFYGLSNDYRSFVYALEDGSGSGRTQLIAMLVLLGASVVAAIVAILCSRTFSDVIKGRERPPYTRPEAPVKAASGGTDDAEDDDSDEDYEPRRRRDNTSRKKKAARARAAAEYKPAPASSDIDELTEQTRRLNEEAEKLEAEARRNDYERARREYEEARRRFEAARRGVSDDK